MGSKTVSPASSRWYLTGQTDWRCGLDDGTLLLVRMGATIGFWRWSVSRPGAGEVAFGTCEGIGAAKGAAARAAARG